MLLGRLLAPPGSCLGRLGGFDGLILVILGAPGKVLEPLAALLGSLGRR